MLLMHLDEREGALRAQAADAQLQLAKSQAEVRHAHAPKPLFAVVGGSTQELPA